MELGLKTLFRRLCLISDLDAFFLALFMSKNAYYDTTITENNPASLVTPGVTNTLIPSCQLFFCYFLLVYKVFIRSWSWSLNIIVLFWF